jgi:hypothetical protein
VLITTAARLLSSTQKAFGMEKITEDVPIDVNVVKYMRVCLHVTRQDPLNHYNVI